jgi:hypothetical protein
MTIKELKNLLNKYPEEYKVYARDIEGGFCNAIDICVEEDFPKGILLITDGIEV